MKTVATADCHKYVQQSENSMLRIHGKQELIQFLQACRFSSQIWIQVCWNLTKAVCPQWWKLNKDGQPISYIYQGTRTHDGFSICQCRWAGVDEDGDTIWQPTTKHYLDGFAHLFWLSCLGATIHFYPNLPQAGAGIANKHVNKSHLVFYEIDDLPLLQQWASLNRLIACTGLKPCCVVFTGGKSLHVYFRLADAVTSTYWLRLNRKLTIIQDSDPNICNPARAMRLPGFVRRFFSNERLTAPVPVTLEQWSDRAYSPEEFEAALDSTGKFPHGLSDERWRLWRNSNRRHKLGEAVDPDAILLKSESELYPQRQYQSKTKFESTCDRIPLEISLTKDDRKLLTNGTGKGSRNNCGYKLARNLIGTADTLNQMGITCYPDARQLFEKYANCCSPPLPDCEREKIWRSACRGNPQPSLSDEAIKNCINAWLQKSH